MDQPNYDRPISIWRIVRVIIGLIFVASGLLIAGMVADIGIAPLLSGNPIVPELVLIGAMATFLGIFIAYTGVRLIMVTDDGRMFQGRAAIAAGIFLLGLTIGGVGLILAGSMNILAGVKGLIMCGGGGWWLLKTGLKSRQQAKDTTTDVDPTVTPIE
ncbi:MAG: hypothetical protein JO142_18515 [Burkholderiales bacterium]|nr:hypothetical protein [Burkholderiales bacterium]